jgi:hypothetical protein
MNNEKNVKRIVEKMNSISKTPEMELLSMAVVISANESVAISNPFANQTIITLLYPKSHMIPKKMNIDKKMMVPDIPTLVFMLPEHHVVPKIVRD